MVPETVPNYQFEIDKEHSQILIEMTDPAKSLDEVTKIIEGLMIYIIATKHLSTSCVLLKLNVKDMREAILRSSELGFRHIKGVHASQPD